MEATAAKLPKGSKERGMLYDITSKMQGIVSVIAPYKESEIIRAEQWDWLPTSSPFYDGNSGFVAVQQQWAINDEKTPEEARFQTEMPVAGRGGSLAKPRIPNNRHMINDKNNSQSISTQNTSDTKGTGGKAAANIAQIEKLVEQERQALARIKENYSDIERKNNLDYRYKPENSILQLQDFRNQVREARKTAPSDSKKSGNVAVARIDIEGLDIKRSDELTIFKHGKLTDGKYTVELETMKPHQYKYKAGKSIFYGQINSEQAVLVAARYADKHNLWIGNKAKIRVETGNIGVLGDGTPTNYINIYRNSNGFIHGSPGTAR